MSTSTGADASVGTAPKSGAKKSESKKKHAAVTCNAGGAPQASVFELLYS